MKVNPLHKYLYANLELFYITTFSYLKEELDEMMASAVDASNGQIPYEYYINSLMV